MTHPIRILIFIAFALMLSHAIPLAADETKRPSAMASKRSLFEQKLTEVAERFIGIPYQFGGNPETSGTADNSHVLCTIYADAAAAAGLTFHGYMPMNRILESATSIPLSEIRSGDLMVLKDGHAALIFRYRDPQRFDLLYASNKKNEVVAFNSENVVFEAYWMKNVEGFYRLNDDLFQDAE